MAKTIQQRLFIGVFPAALVYADRSRERAGDYARLACLTYHNLELCWERDCPAGFREPIERHAQAIIAKRGELFQISECGQNVLLGGGLRA